MEDGKDQCQLYVNMQPLLSDFSLEKTNATDHLLKISVESSVEFLRNEVGLHQLKHLLLDYSNTKLIVTLLSVSLNLIIGDSTGQVALYLDYHIALLHACGSSDIDLASHSYQCLCELLGSVKPDIVTSLILHEGYLFTLAETICGNFHSASKLCLNSCQLIYRILDFRCLIELDDAVHIIRAMGDVFDLLSICMEVSDMSLYQYHDPDGDDSCIEWILRSIRLLIAKPQIFIEFFVASRHRLWCLVTLAVSCDLDDSFIFTAYDRVVNIRECFHANIILRDILLYEELRLHVDENAILFEISRPAYSCLILALCEEAVVFRSPVAATACSEIALFVSTKFISSSDNFDSVLWRYCSSLVELLTDPETHNWISEIASSESGAVCLCALHNLLQVISSLRVAKHYALKYDLKRAVSLLSKEIL